jgi:hypothetical protein
VTSTTIPTNAQANFINYDADPLQYSIQILQNGTAIDTTGWTVSIASSGQASIKPPAARHGAFEVKVIAQAMSGGQPILNKTAELRTSLTVGNSLPVLTPEQISDKTFNIGRNNAAILPLAVDPDGDAVSFTLYDSSTGEEVSHSWLQTRQISNTNGWQYEISGTPPSDAPDSLTLQANYYDGHGGLIQKSFKLNIVNRLQLEPRTNNDVMQQASTADDTYLISRRVISPLGDEPVTVKITYDQSLGNMVTRTLSGISSSLTKTGGFSTWQISGPKEAVNEHLGQLQFIPSRLIKGPGKIFNWNVHNGVERDLSFTTMLNINPINLAPEVANTIPPVDARASGEEVTIVFSRTYFADPDNEPLELRWKLSNADDSELGPNLKFNNATLTLSGVMYQEERLKITVTDPDGKSTSQLFTIPYKPTPAWWVTFDWKNLTALTGLIPLYLLRRAIATHANKAWAEFRQQPFVQYAKIRNTISSQYTTVKDQLKDTQPPADAPIGVASVVNKFKKLGNVGEPADDEDTKLHKEASQEDLARILNRIVKQFQSGNVTERTLQLIDSFKAHVLVYASTHQSESAYLELGAQKLIVEYSEYVCARLSSTQKYEIGTYAKLELIRALACLLLLTETANSRKVLYARKLEAYKILDQVPDFKLDEDKLRAKDQDELGKAAIKYSLKTAMAAIACAPDDDFWLKAIILKRPTIVPVAWHVDIIKAEGLAPFARYSSLILEEIISIHQACKLEYWHVRYAIEAILQDISQHGSTEKIKGRAKSYLESVAPAQKQSGEPSKSLSATQEKRRKGQVLSGVGAGGHAGSGAFIQGNPMHATRLAASSSDLATNSQSPPRSDHDTVVVVGAAALPAGNSAKRERGAVVAFNPLAQVQAQAVLAQAEAKGQPVRSGFFPVLSRRNVVLSTAPGPSASADCSDCDWD